MKKKSRLLAKAQKPIGVFDSGLGGLSIVRQIRRTLPAETIVYFGDLARLPYGTKSKEQILSFSIQNTLFLIRHKVKAVVIACNSSSSAAYLFLKKHFNLPMVDVVEPAVAEAVKTTRKGRIGVIATQATIDSRAYEKGLKSADPRIKVFTAPCPLFVPLVEEGWLNGSITSQIIDFYLEPLKRKEIDTLILGCTHYPMLSEAISKAVGKQIRLVDSVAPTVEKLTSLLEEKQLSYLNLDSRLRGNDKNVMKRGELKIFVSDSPRNFVRVGERFLGEKLNHVEVVR